MVRWARDCGLTRPTVNLSRRHLTLAGAMAPASVAGATVQQNAEALAMVALAQCVRPGTPVIYGGFTSNVDMKSGSPAFGTPEYPRPS